MTSSRPVPVDREKVAVHYETVDPHRQVAHSKEFFFKHVLERLGKPNIGLSSLLDIGCGYGYFLQAAAGEGWRVAGIEIAPAAAEAAARTVGRRNILAGTLRDAAFPDENFDAVTLWDVLVFSDKIEKDLSECFRILKSGGTIGLRVRNVTFQKWLFLACLPFIPLMRRFNIRSPYVFHPYNFSVAAIRHLLERLGFVDIQVLNSPLTLGDPYGSRKTDRLIGGVKTMVASAADALHWFSGGRWIVGPSLLVWAAKPASRNAYKD
jgi:SAM-dependent methyltransferase